ncbi:hypothetical protein C8J56DRAFT_568544 [Mycena floridula]|nr:hypothetical protein C8J56DRAFT_568544 [Mycena floridula]
MKGTVRIPSDGNIFISDNLVNCETIEFKSLRNLLLAIVDFCLLVELASRQRHAGFCDRLGVTNCHAPSQSRPTSLFKCSSLVLFPDGQVISNMSRETQRCARACLHSSRNIPAYFQLSMRVGIRRFRLRVNKVRTLSILPYLPSIPRNSAAVFKSVDLRRWSHESHNESESEEVEAWTPSILICIGLTGRRPFSNGDGPACGGMQPGPPGSR